MITVYSQLLAKAYPSKPEDDANMFVEYILGGTRRMRELLADLLAYSEIGMRPELPRSEVDLNTVFENVRENLRAAIDDSGAVVTADKLPALMAHEGYFVSLFQNLIGNAIKYRSAQPPHIHVSIRKDEEHMIFAVTDNGIGIEAEYREKIFAPFKRLHGKDIPGTGIGLAICQRIVERYGGRIWVESEPGKGAAFFFTLPRHLGIHGGGNA